MDKLPITLCIVTCNSADRLEKMVEKHKGIVSEVLIAVQDSTDGTMEIAERVADCAIRRTRKGAADPDRNWLFAMADQPWVLYLDDDEYIDDDLKMALSKLLEGRVDIYWLKTRNLIDGKDAYKILGGDYHPRLFKRGVVRYKDQKTALDHTYPEAADGAKVAFVDYPIVHDRTYEKVVSSNRNRNKIATPEQVQMQENFIKQVKELLGKD